MGSTKTRRVLRRGLHEQAEGCACAGGRSRTAHRELGRDPSPIVSTTTRADSRQVFASLVIDALTPEVGSGSNSTCRTSATSMPASVGDNEMHLGRTPRVR